MAKQKPKVDQETTIKDWQEADNLLLEIGTADQNIKKMTAEMNLKLNAIHEKYDSALDELKADKIGKERNLQLFCEEHRDEFTDDSKSKKLSFGIVSFRLGTGALKTLKGWTWKSVEEYIKKFKNLKEKYLVVKTTLNKEEMKASMNKNELAKVGCYIHQEENFYYECFERK